MTNEEKDKRIVELEKLLEENTKPTYKVTEGYLHTTNQLISKKWFVEKTLFSASAGKMITTEVGIFDDKQAAITYKEHLEMGGKVVYPQSPAQRMPYSNLSSGLGLAAGAQGRNPFTSY